MARHVTSLASLCVERFLDTALAAALQRRTFAQLSEAEEDDVGSTDSAEAQLDNSLACSSQSITSSLMLSEISDRLLALLTNSVIFDEETVNQLFIRDDSETLQLGHSRGVARVRQSPTPCETPGVSLRDVRSLRIVYDEYRIKRIAKTLQQLVSTRALSSFDCQASESPQTVLEHLVQNSAHSLRVLRFSETDFYEDARNVDGDSRSDSVDDSYDVRGDESYWSRFSDDEYKMQHSINDSNAPFVRAQWAQEAIPLRSVGTHLCSMSRLTVLCVNNSDLSDEDLEAICSTLRLRVLNVAFCRDLSGLKPVGQLADSLRELSANHVPLGNSVSALHSLHRLVRLDVAIRGESFVRKPDAAAINALLGASVSDADLAADSDSESDWETEKRSDSDWEESMLDWVLQQGRRAESQRRHRSKRSKFQFSAPDERPSVEDVAQPSCSAEPESFWPCIRQLDVSGWQSLRFPVLEHFVKSHCTLRDVAIVNAGSTADVCRFNNLRCDFDLRRISGLTRSLNVTPINAALRNKLLLSDTCAAQKQLHTLMQLLVDHEKIAEDRYLVPSMIEGLVNVTRSHIGRPAIVTLGIRCIFMLTVEYLVRLESDTLATRLLELLVTALEHIEYGNSPIDYVTTLVQQCMRILYRCIVYGHTMPSDDIWFHRTILVIVNAVAYHFNMNKQILGMDALCTLNTLTQRWKRIAPQDFPLKNESARALVEKLILALSASVSEFASSVVQADEMAGELHNGLRAALSTLTRITDENPLACEIFAKYSLPIHMRFVKMCTNPALTRGRRNAAIAHHHESFLFSVNNMAEVASLRRFFTVEHIETICNDLVHPAFEIVYHACSILANILSSMREQPTSCTFERSLALFERGIERLDTLTRSETIGIFYTLNPIYIFVQQDIEAVQYFGCWTIDYLVKRDSGRYLPMLLKENACSLLQRRILDDVEASERCKMIAFDVIERVENFEATEIDQP